MKSARQRHTEPELTVRKALWASGYRYRLHYPVPGLNRRSIDIALVNDRIAVFVDGCFWHGCPVHATQPRANADWWRAKLTANQDRDRDTDLRLERAGWTVVRVWEHDEAGAVVDRVSALFER
jgi:DNA mismatch endonuclease (patch repair protein)